MTDAPAPLLDVRDLHVYYGHAHALQGISLTLDHGILSVVGRNGMGKTTLCNTIMGLVPAAGGSITVAGHEILGLHPNRIVAHGLGYVPQGRRVWPSLTVDEHLRVARRRSDGNWTLERVYDTFPALAERRRHGGAQLSGGEQQMLAIGRALLANPRLLIMDEPTEGLAPIIVDQVALMLKHLADEGEISVLLIEQNLGVATDVSNRIAVMVNGRIARDMGARELAADEELQQRLLGVGAQEEEPEARPELDIPAAPGTPGAVPAPAAQVFRVRRQAASEDAVPAAPPPVYTAAAAPTFWSQGNPRGGPTAAGAPADAAEADAPAPQAEPSPDARPAPPIAPIPAAAGAGRVAYIAGTFDTKGRELTYLQSCIDRLGVRSLTVDLSTSQAPSPADIGPAEVARHHPKGAAAVFTGDRGSAVAAMAEAFARFIATRRDLGGLISAGGSGATALATPAMRALPVGVPKVMVSTVASGDVKAYVGPADICMMYSVTDVSGINSISERVLANAAHALAGMIGYRRPARAESKPAVGLTMFGVTTPCVQAVARALEAEYDCLTFHATGTGGQSMEKLVDSGLLAGVVDITTTEVCDLLMGGVFSAGEDRLGAIIRTRVPYVGSCGALDMVNWGPMDTVPERFRDRNLYVHNPQVTLMRTTAAENERMGRWIGERLNRMEGPVRFLLPEGGVSLLDAPGMAFHDPEADRALFAALEAAVQQTDSRRLVRLPNNLNDPDFANALVAAFREVMAGHGGENAEIRARRAS